MISLPFNFFPLQALLSNHLVNLHSNGPWCRALSTARRRLCISHRWRGRRSRRLFLLLLFLLLSLHLRHRRRWARRRRRSRSKEAKSQGRWPQNPKNQRRSGPSNRFRQWQRRSGSPRRTTGLSSNLPGPRSVTVLGYSELGILVVSHVTAPLFFFLN